jgi:hypothetical protein
VAIGDWVRLLGFVALVTLLGRAVLQPFANGGGRLLRDWSAAWLVGQLVLLVATLLTGFTPVTHGMLLAVAGAVALATALLALRRSAARAAAACAVAAGSLLATALLFPDLLLLVQRTPVIETDARGIWMFHGKALFVANGIDASFFTDPLYAWSSPDYPLLLPAQTAWSSLVLGRWDDVACRAWLWPQLAAWLRLVFLVLRARGHPAWLAAAIACTLAMQGFDILGVPGYPFVSGQADYHCAVPLVLALLLVVGPAAPGRAVAAHADARAASVLLLAYAANAKNEGTVYAIALALGWLAVAAVVHARRGGRGAGIAAARAASRTWLLAVLLGLLPWALWAVWKAQHGVASNLHVAERATSPALVAELVATRLPTVLRLLVEDVQARESVWLLAALGALFAFGIAAHGVGAGTRVRAAELAVGLAWLTVMAMIVAAYVMTPHDFVFHMQTSVTRLLYLPHLLLLAACVLRGEALLAHGRGGDPVPAAAST